MPRRRHTHSAVSRGPARQSRPPLITCLHPHSYEPSTPPTRAHSDAPRPSRIPVPAPTCPSPPRERPRPPPIPSSRGSLGHKAATSPRHPGERSGGGVNHQRRLESIRLDAAAECGRKMNNEVQQRCTRGATEVQHRCNRGATEEQHRATEVQQRGNRDATEMQQRAGTVVRDNGCGP
jgi:hypothetical protein